MPATTTTDVTINNLPDELLRLISILGGPTEYCNFRRAMKRVWLYTTGREDHCIKHFLVTKVIKYGVSETTLCGNYHSIFDQPAITHPYGTRWWYRYGKLHRDNDLPATIWAGGSKEWYQYGKHHRNNDSPAYIRADGTKLWYQYGKTHRDNDLPATIWPDGTKRWFKHSVEYTP